MKINQIALRQKESHLLTATENQMSINIAYPEAKIISEEKNIIHLIKKLIIRIVSGEIQIANFTISVQCEAELDNGESFSHVDFDNMILPALYSYINQMMGEMNLPAFPISVLYDFYKKK